MPKEKRSKVVDGVHFVWVPKRKNDPLAAHWLSTNCPWTVRVFEPGAEISGWCAVIYKEGLIDLIFEGVQNQKMVWKQAVEWAKNGKEGWKKQG